MRRGRLLILGTATAAVAAMATAQERDPIGSAECRAALDALQAAEAASAPPAGASGVMARLQPLRERAALACLGGRAGPPPSQRLLQPPQRVAPVQIPSSAARPVPQNLSPSPPPPVLPSRAEPPVLVLGCNDSGCWTSDGLFMPRSGSTLFGPRGWCRVQGATLLCP